MKKRVIAVVSVMVGLAVGLAIGPVTSNAAQSKIKTYRCMGDPVADAGGVIHIHNPSKSKTITVEQQNRNEGGVEGVEATHTILPLQTVIQPIDANAVVVELRTRSRILLDGWVGYFNGAGADSDMARQIRCTP